MNGASIRPWTGFIGAALLAWSVTIACGGGDATDLQGGGTGPGSGAGGAGDGIGFGGSGFGLGGTTSSGGGPPVLPPEVELEKDFEVPVATGTFVWTANPESNRVTLIDARTLAVTSLEAGFRPRYLTALATQEGEAAALVLNELSHDANVFRATSLDATETSESIPVHAAANAWATSRTGRWAIAWTDAERVENADPTDGFQDITVIDLASRNRPTATRLSVGFRPSGVLVSTDEGRAFAITEVGISIIDLAASSGPSVLADMTISDRRAAEVSVTPDGRFALARFADQDELTIVSLADGRKKQIRLGQPATDLDLSADASVAVAVMRSSGAGESPGENAGGQAGEGGQPGNGVEPSAVALLPIPGIFEDPTNFRTLEVDELFGSVAVPRSGSKVLLYTNAVPSDRLTILDTELRSHRTVALKAPVQAVFPTPNAEHAVALLSTPVGSQRAGAFSLVPVASPLPPKLQGADAPMHGLSISDTHAIITTRSAQFPGEPPASFGAFLASFPALAVRSIELPTAPTASGIVEDAEVAFVAQEHPQGRLTFADLSTGDTRTLTGFELGIRIDDGD